VECGETFRACRLPCRVALTWRALQRGLRLVSPCATLNHARTDFQNSVTDIINQCLRLPTFPKDNRHFRIEFSEKAAVCERSASAFTVILTLCPWNITLPVNDRLYQRATPSCHARERTDYAFPSPPQDCSAFPQTAHPDLITFERKLCCHSE